MTAPKDLKKKLDKQGVINLGKMIGISVTLAMNAKVNAAQPLIQMMVS